jgi:hypothetical protein
MNIELVRNFSKILSLYESIGSETVRALVSVNAHVIMTTQDMNKSAQIVEDIQKSTGNEKVEGDRNGTYFTTISMKLYFLISSKKTDNQYSYFYLIIYLFLLANVIYYR